MASVNLKQRKAIALMMFLVLLGLAEAVWLVNLYRHRLNFACSAYFRYQLPDSDYAMTANTQIQFSNQGWGTLSMDGDLIYRGKRYLVRRDATFNYIHISDEKYQLQEINVLKSGRDNAPDEVLSRYFYSISPEAGRYITVSMIDNVYLIGSLYNPSFMCYGAAPATL
ncbi:hypothetical protein [Entomohabitans teleogrylli]|uniref:hypothetical protein n=1 Tax=Entomohabitans teleogrylli TaxID=1384589 RepID=UPI00073D89E4|nr:hypothetical protein [Entomohabitans teleogrylli]